MRLKVAALHSLRKTEHLGNIIDTILSEMEQTFPYDPAYPNPPIYKWRAFLRNCRINVLFSHHLNQGWTVEDRATKDDFSIRLLFDLAELTEKPADHRLSVHYFRFYFTVTVLHELTHLITESAFPGNIMPNVPESCLQFGAGMAFEHKMLGGALVFEWEDVKHVGDLGYLCGLFIRSLYNHQDYLLNDADILNFLDKLGNPTRSTAFALDIRNRQPSVMREGRVRTLAGADRKRVHALSLAKGKSAINVSRNAKTETVKTIMLGRGICYHRDDLTESERLNAERGYEIVN